MMSSTPQELFKYVRRIQIRTKRHVKDLLAGSYHSAFKGKGMEFEDVREYQVGDDVRHIDWNVTARMNNPYIKNFSEERELTVLLLVDISASCLFGSLEKNKKEMLAEIAALLAFSAIENNDKVGLILFSDQIELYLPPKKGLKHGLRVIRELLAFEPKHTCTNFLTPLSFLANIQKRQGVCFFLSDFLSPLPQKTFTLIAKRHDLIGLSMLDPKEWELPKKGLFLFRDLETGEKVTVDTSQRKAREWYETNFRKEQEKISYFFNRIGADFIHFRTDESYVSHINQFFKAREARAC